MAVVVNTILCFPILMYETDSELFVPTERLQSEKEAV